jgi:hypothetical protein
VREEKDVRGRERKRTGGAGKAKRRERAEGSMRKERKGKERMRKKKVLFLEKSTHSSRAQDRALVYLAGYLWAHTALSNSAGTRHLWARTALSNSAGPLTRIQATSIDLIMGNTPSSAAAHAPITTPAGLPLPPTLHATLPPTLSTRRTIIVGDIHGCTAELQALLAKLSFDPSADVLISVGDAVNKGPDSLGVVRLLAASGAFLVRGNHDEAALAVAAAARRGASPPLNPSAPHAWAADPGAADAVSYLASSPFSLFLPAHALLVVHAGLLPGVALEAQALDDLVELRHVRAEVGGRWAGVPKKAAQKGVGKPWARAFSGAIPGLGPDIHVVFGHHASRRLQAEPHATGIDTACVNGDSLTALVLPGSGGAGKSKRKKGGKVLGYERLGATLVSVPAGSQYTADPAE